MPHLVVNNISELVTLAPLKEANRFHQVTRADLGILADAWLEIRGSKVAAFGSGPLPTELQSLPVVDAQRRVVCPGFIDAHTHPIFAGDRSNEFAQKLAGKSYQEIALTGGGIMSTVTATRQASNADLRELTKKRLHRFLENGVTTVECKSGYGLSVEHELRLLQILKELQSDQQNLEITCLALHAVPTETPSKAQFIQTMTYELLPEVQRQGLATWVDAFVEKGYFDPADCEPYFVRAQELGFKLRIHADEFVESGAAAAAAHWGAASADHLQKASADGIQAMGKAGTVAILLPGTSLYSNIAFTQASPFRVAGCPIAIATDFNPGSCVMDNISLAATIAAVHCRLSGAEAFAAITWVAARSLRLEHRKGSLTPGYDADFLILPFDNLDQWIADLGRHRPTQVYCGGRRVI